jgi:hypothetical protein
MRVFPVDNTGPFAIANFKWISPLAKHQPRATMTSKHKVILGRIEPTQMIANVQTSNKIQLQFEPSAAVLAKSWLQLGPPWSNSLTELASIGFLTDLVLLQ